MKAVRTLVVVCDDKDAGIFENAGVGKGLTEIERICASDKAGSDYSDRPGRGQAAPGMGRHGFTRPVDQKVLDRSGFASEIVKRLGRHARKADRVGLVAAPAMLGEMRRSLPAQLGAMVAWEVDKDLTKSTAAELADRLSHVAAF